jgi:hypothetical protein
LAETKIKHAQKESLVTIEIDGTPGTQRSTRTVSYRMKNSGDDIEEILVNGAWYRYDSIGDDDNDERIRDLDEFRFCYQVKVDDPTNPPPDAIQIPPGPNKPWFVCHQPVDVTNEATFVSNPRSCPVFIKPPGIWVDPCK